MRWSCPSPRPKKRSPSPARGRPPCCNRFGNMVSWEPAGFAVVLRGEKPMEIRLMELGDYRDVYSLWLSCPGMGLNNLDDSQEGSPGAWPGTPPPVLWPPAGPRHRGDPGGPRRQAGLHWPHGGGPRLSAPGALGGGWWEAAVDALRAEGIHKVNLVVFARNQQGQRLLGEDGIYPGPDLTYRNRTLVTWCAWRHKKHSHAGYNFPLKKPGIFIKS